MTVESQPTRRQVIEQFVPNSPLVQHLGIRLEEVGDDVAVLALPFSEQVCTMGDVVHGGAISTLADTAAMAAAWADDEVPEALAGATVSLTVEFVNAARATDLTARAEVVKRGRSLSFIDITVRDTAGEVVAKALATYKFG
jgi:uncharacterized protein (TIGR00369 family)